jgi:permease MlaE
MYADLALSHSGQSPGPPHPSPAALRPDRIGSGARQTPSCWHREVAFVLIRPVHRSIDGGGLSGLACRSPGPARSTREKVADVHCYADLLGLFGGMAVGGGMLDIGIVEYYVRTAEAISIGDCVAGLIKASVFGVLVAVAGCLRGIQCGRSSAAVGAATTSAVVTGIVLIIVSDALTTGIFDLIGL